MRVILHCIHGSVSRAWWKKDPRPRVGGLLGGHVVIECGNDICHFDNKKMPTRLWYSDRPDNSFVVVEDVEYWKSRTQNDQITSYVIAVTDAEYQLLGDFIGRFKTGELPTPYNYAFFGYRCYAFAFDILSRVGIVNIKSKFLHILYGFIPPIARKVIGQELSETKKEYSIKYRKGENIRIWENF
jgi:hypothetical protein